jgi:pyruvate/2-oxoglutarate dehydrogenase complex dihydrolipoamide acyltransferase (E2) component
MTRCFLPGRLVEHAENGSFVRIVIIRSIHDVALELKLPANSAEMEYGTIVRWLKAEGDRVGQDEPVVEVEADKVTVEIESPVAGVQTRIDAAEGDEIPVGTTLALIEEDPR